MDYVKISTKFWELFKDNEETLYLNLLKREDKCYNNAVNIISNIKTSLEIVDSIGTYFSIDTRNGLKLEERIGHVEFIITPLFQRNNQQLMNALYNAHHSFKLPKYWTVVKFKFFQPQFINTISINYDSKHDNTSDSKDTNSNVFYEKKLDSSIVEITQDDFMYSIAEHDQKDRINILLFINNNVASYLVKKEKYNNRDILIPVDTSIHAILDSAIGEYNLLNVLDKMEIHTMIELDNPEFKDLQIKKINNLIQEFDVINYNPLSGINKCARCGFINKQVKNYVCKCRNVYYCDKVCQKAHYGLHKKFCVK